MKKKIVTDIIQWDVNTWSKPLQFWQDNINWNTVETCLELGGRQGGLSLWLALKDKSVLCSDLENVQNTADPLHKKYNIGHKIKYENIDATTIPYENYFDVIVFKSIIGGIGRNNDLEIQKKVFDQIYKALKPGGKLLFAENLIASPLHQFFRKKFNKWGSYWRYISLEETEYFLSNFKSFQIHQTGVLGTFGRNEAQRNFLSKLDDVIFNRITPKNWKYIVYGVAEK